MDISLKQPEIVKAISMYLSSQGINTRNKAVTADFAMGRGENGLTVVMSIEETIIPGYDNDTSQVNDDLAKLVDATQKKTKVIHGGTVGARAVTANEDNAVQAASSTDTSTAAKAESEDNSNVETVNAEDVGATNANPFGGDIVNDTPVSDTEGVPNAPAAAVKTASIFGS